MQYKGKILFLFVLAVIMGAALAACSSGTNQKAVMPGQPTIIKIAVLPVLDTLPMYVADKEELFAKYNVAVEFIPAGSAPKRDEMINAGQADGMINEIVSTIFYNRDETRVQIVRYARTATQDSGIFQILASGQSGINRVEQLKGVEIGISQGTVIEYLTDRLLQAEGFAPEEIQTIAVPDIGQRMALLGSGDLHAAMLPDPLASLVLQQGAVFVLDDSRHPDYSHSVYTFRKAFIDQNPDALRDFLAAVEEAVDLINAHPEKYNELLSERELVPPPLAGKFSVPKFVTAGVPTQSQWDDVISWVNEKGLEAGKATYENSVNDNFLP
jgi:NitT/TauT family transport system substrate-binding protein